MFCGLITGNVSANKIRQQSAAHLGAANYRQRQALRDLFLTSCGKDCTAAMPTSIGARLRYTLDRESQAYKDIYKQRTAVERINSQAVALGIERPHIRNGQAIANLNTLIYLLINLRVLQRIRQRCAAPD